MNTIGTCSECGGAVQVPECWGGSVPPTPTCSSCGAKARNPYGEVIPMVPRSNREDTERLAKRIFALDDMYFEKLEKLGITVVKKKPHTTKP